MQPVLLDDMRKTLFAVTSKEPKFTAPYILREGSPTNATFVLSHFIWIKKVDNSYDSSTYLMSDGHNMRKHLIIIHIVNYSLSMMGCL